MRTGTAPFVLPLSRAALCLDCDVISDLVEYGIGCPTCASTRRELLTRWLDRRNGMGTDTYYVLGGLDGCTPVPTDDLRAWTQAFGREVALTELPSLRAVRTTFVGHDPTGATPPLVFVTRLEGTSMTEVEPVGTATWGAAVAAHHDMVTRWTAPPNG